MYNKNNFYIHNKVIYRRTAPFSFAFSQNAEHMEIRLTKLTQGQGRNCDDVTNTKRLSVS